MNLNGARDHSGTGSPERVLIFAPFGRDAVVLDDLLVRSRVECEICLDFDDLLEAVRGEVGVLLLTEEAIPTAAIPRLLEVLQGQPSWSDLPVVILADREWPARGRSRELRALRETSNTIVIQRPAAGLMLTTTVRSSLRARRRQYETRDLLERTETLNAKLRETLDRERLAVESAELGFWDLNILTNQARWETRHNRMMGLPEDQTEGRYEQFMDRINPQDRPTVVEAMDEAISGRKRFEAEFRSMWPDGTSRWIGGLGRAVVDDRGDTVRITGVVQDITNRKRLEESLRHAHVEMEARVAERTAELARTNAALRSEINGRLQAETARQDLLRRLATAQEVERKRIARDLHDQFGQLLTALIMGVGAAQEAAPLPGRTVDLLGKVRRIADELGRSVHDIAVRLRPTALDDLGLHAALMTLLDEGAGVSDVKIDFQADGIKVNRLPPEIETILYRVIQEAITNTLKYAAARQVSVIIMQQKGNAIAVVEDNGIGFDTSAQPPTEAAGGGLGLLGMRERVALVGGTLHVESAPGQGTTVVARVPLPAPAPAPKPA